MDNKSFCSLVKSMESKSINTKLDCMLKPQQTVEMKCFQHNESGNKTEVTLDMCQKNYPTMLTDHIEANGFEEMTKDVNCSTSYTKCEPKLVVEAKIAELE